MNSIARSKTPYLAGSEEVEDTEMVHAIAPGAVLDVVLMPHDATASIADIAAATTKAIQAGVAMHAGPARCEEPAPPLGTCGHDVDGSLGPRRSRRQPRPCGPPR